MPEDVGGAIAGDGSRPPPLGGVLLEKGTVQDLLDLVVTLTGRTVEGADGVSVSLQRDGLMHTANASDGVVRELDSIQYREDRGPCVEATQTGRSVLVSLGAEPDRYPVFCSAALRCSMTGVLSSPLWVQDQPVGALNVYSASAEGFREREVELAGLFSRQAATILASAVASAAAELQNEQLKTALITRGTIGQAKGILMANEGCSAEEAFDRLRERSQHLAAPEHEAARHRPGAGRRGATPVNGPMGMLAAAVEQAEVNLSSLWLLYVGLGGTASMAEVGAHVRDEATLDRHQHDVLVHALNERFSDMDLDHPIPYSN